MIVIRLSKDDIEKNGKPERAAQYKEEDENNKTLVESKNALENYLYSVKNSLNDEMKSKLGTDCEVIETTVEDGLNWLSNNPTVDKADIYDDKLKELQEVLMPLMAKAAPSPGGMPGGMKVECQEECQVECQEECQVECQEECQVECQEECRECQEGCRIWTQCQEGCREECRECQEGCRECQEGCRIWTQCQKRKWLLPQVSQILKKWIN